MSETRSLDLLVEDYFTGTRCPHCRTAITSTGCRCSRERFHRDAMDEVSTWVDKLPAMPENPTTKADKELVRRLATARSAVSAASARSAIRTGYRDMPVGTADNPTTVTVAQDERLAWMERFGTEPKWHQPTTVRTSRADHEPL